MPEIRKTILHYDFETHDFSSNVVKDLSGNGNDGVADDIIKKIFNSKTYANFRSSGSYIQIPKPLLELNKNYYVIFDMVFIDAVDGDYGVIFANHYNATYDGVQCDITRANGSVKLAHKINNNWQNFIDSNVNIRDNKEHNIWVDVSNESKSLNRIAIDKVYKNGQSTTELVPVNLSKSFTIGKYPTTVRSAFVEMYLRNFKIIERVNLKSAIVEPETNDMYSLTPTNQPVVIGNMDSNVALIKDTLLKDGKNITELGKNILPNYKKNSFKITTLVP